MSMDHSMMMSDSGSPSMTMDGGMPMETSAADMGMHMSGDMMMGMSSMAMTFFTSPATPLYSMSWTPTTTGQYAGTCIFLIAFAALFRALLAFRVRFHEVMALVRQRRRRGMEPVPTTIEKPVARPWKANEAVSLAAMDVLLAGTSYLLMIAVMTMNVGYFLSVLAGVFVGSLVFGHFISNSAAH